jgi:tRNA A-37 threonylcarbamoyl transferase component Bud32
MLARGSILSGRYEILRLIGEGGMGAVYEARHVSIGKRVALKVLSKDLVKDEEAIKRFQREAQIAGSLGHVNICEVMDFGVDENGAPFLVMEFLEGYSLAEIIALEKRLTLVHACDIMSQVLYGLEEAHGKGIVHRDLKPENIFVTQMKGFGEVAKILDFGISKIMKSGPESMRLTKTGALIGTPYYMSPEQVRGRKDLDARCDLYACGVIFYEMLTGKVPFWGETFNEIIVRIIEEEAPDPRTIVPDLREDAVVFIRRCIDKDICRRPASAAEMKMEIESLVSPFARVVEPTVEKKISTRTASVISQEPQQRRRGILIGGILGLAVIAVAATLIALFVGVGPGKNAGSPPKKTVQEPIEMKVDGLPVPAAAPVDDGKPSPTVKLIIDGVPELTVLKMGKTLAEGSVIEVEKSSEEKTLTVIAPGYKSKQLLIVPDEDKIISVKFTKMDVLMEAVDEKPVEAAPEESPNKKEKKTDGAKESPAETKGKKKPGEGEKGGPSLKWDYPEG